MICNAYLDDPRNIYGCHYCTENLKNQIYMKILEHFTRGDGKSFQGEQT